MKIIHLFKFALLGVATLLPFVSSGQLHPVTNPVRKMTPPYVYGQGIINVPLGVLPMQYNSSFAGEAGGIRLNTAFAYNVMLDSETWKDQDFSYHASFDKFIPALRTGIGISVHRGTVADEFTLNAPDGIEVEKLTFSSNRISLAVAPKFSIAGKLTISPSVDFSYGRGKTEANFPANMGPIDYAHYYKPGEHQWLESRLGLLLNTSKYYIGYTAYLMNRHYHNNEETGLLSNEYISYLQAGYTFQRNPDSKFSFTPQFAYRIGANQEMSFGEYIFNAGAINFSFRYDKYLAGFNNTGIHLGWQNEKVRVVTSINPFASGDWDFGAGNLSLRYIFKD